MDECPRLRAAILPGVPTGEPHRFVNGGWCMMCGRRRDDTSPYQTILRLDLTEFEEKQWLLLRS